MASAYGQTTYPFSCGIYEPPIDIPRSSRRPLRRTRSRSQPAVLLSDRTEQQQPTNRTRAWSQPDLSQHDLVETPSEPKKISRLRKWLRSLTRFPRRSSSSRSLDWQVIEGRDIEVSSRRQATPDPPARRHDPRWPRPSTPYPSFRIARSPPPAYESALVATEAIADISAVVNGADPNTVGMDAAGVNGGQ